MKSVSPELPEKKPARQDDIKSPKSLYCAHQFFDLLERDRRIKDGDEIWFHCMNCLMTIKKKLTDESSEL